MTQAGLVALFASLLLLVIGTRMIVSTVFRRNPSSFALLISVVLWMLAQALVYELPPGQLRLAANTLQYCALGWLPPFLVGTALSFGRLRPETNLRALAVIAPLSVLTNILVVTTGQTGLLFNAIGIDPANGRLIKTHGPLYPVFVAYLVAAAVLAVILMLRQPRGRPLSQNRRARILTAVFVIPAVFSIADSLGLHLADGTSLIPFALLSASIILLWGVAGSRLLSPLSRAQESVVDSLEEPVIIADWQGGLLYANPAADHLSLPGNSVATAFPGLAGIPRLPAADQVRLGDTDWAVHTTVCKSDDPEMVTSIIVLHNVSVLAAQAQRLENLVRERTDRLEEAVREKELLLNELHHRVKNNLQIIISLINLQAKRVNGQSDIREICLSMKERIRAIALAHERMYRNAASVHEQLDLASYVAELVNGTAGLYRTPDMPPPSIRLESSGWQVSVEHCVDLGLVITELVANAYKHAIKMGNVPLEVSLGPGPHGMRVVIRDHGPGLPPDAGPNPEHLGMLIVHSILHKYDTCLDSGLDGGAWVGFDLSIEAASAKKAFYSPLDDLN